MVEFAGVVRSFDHRPVLRGVDLCVAGGEAVAVLGANGSGKSTLLRMTAMLLTPTRGTVRVFGTTAGRSAAVRRRVGFVSHESLLYDNLTMDENLRFFAGLYGVEGHRVDALLDEMALGAMRTRRVRSLSRGQRQLADLARALLHEPDLLILDEPFTGLDLDAAAGVERLLRAQRSHGRTILFATHGVHEARSLADRAAVLHAGRLTEAASPQALDGAQLAAQFGEVRR